MHLERLNAAQDAAQSALEHWSDLQLERDLKPMFMGAVDGLKESYLGALTETGRLR